MEGKDAQICEQKREQVFTGKLSRGDEGTLREDRHTEDPPFQVQGDSTYCGTREETERGKEGLTLPRNSRIDKELQALMLGALLWLYPTTSHKIFFHMR